MPSNDNKPTFKKATTEVIRRLRQQRSLSNKLQPIKSIDRQILELQCSIKKLELKLRLVDGEDIKKEDFDFLIFNIENYCPNDNDNTTKKFIAEMTEKREENNQKKAEDIQKEADDDQTELVEFFNFYLPSLSLFAAIAISYLSTTEITPENITKSTVIYNTFIINFLKTIKPYIEDSATYMDLFSKGLGLYQTEINMLTDKAYVPITNSLKVAKSAISKNSKDFYKIMPTMLQKATDKSMNHLKSFLNSNKYSKITPKLMWAFTMFCIACYFIIFFMYMIFDDPNDDSSNTAKILLNITYPIGTRQDGHDVHGGKMSKKAKNSKKPKKPKSQKVKKQTNL